MCVCVCVCVRVFWFGLFVCLLFCFVLMYNGLLSTYNNHFTLSLSLSLSLTGCDRGHAVISLFICVHFIWIDLGIPHISLQCVVLRCNEACDVVG